MNAPYSPTCDIHILFPKADPKGRLKVAVEAMDRAFFDGCVHNAIEAVAAVRDLLPEGHSAEPQLEKTAKELFWCRSAFGHGSPHRRDYLRELWGKDVCRTSDALRAEMAGDRHLAIHVLKRRIWTLAHRIAIVEARRSEIVKGLPKGNYKHPGWKRVHVINQVAGKARDRLRFAKLRLSGLEARVEEMAS